MDKNILQQAEQYTHKRKRRKNWKKVVTCLSAAVVFVTTYSLILPAITMEQMVSCGMEEHQHSALCYEAAPMEPALAELICEPEVHSHSEECYDAEGELICGLADFLIHTHNEICYYNDELICPLPEVEEHTHDEACFETEEILICELEEDYHIHEETCYTIETGQPVCEQEESEGHTHTDACYQWADELTCGEEERDGHQHTETCYTRTQGEPICGQEESEGHSHDDGCFEQVQVLTCETPENPEGHTHALECYEEKNELICGEEPVVVHTHDETCLDETENLICGLLAVEEHVHTEDCLYIQESVPKEDVLICLLEEHTHTEECMEYPIHLEKPEDLETNCGMVAHGHDESCYTSVLICEILPEENEGHDHTEDCYETEMTCELEEHTHSLACQSDPEADVETETQWEASFERVELSGKPSEDVLAIAKSQLGYRESIENYYVTEDGLVTRGYTRYGDWYGDSYGDWCAMFVSFCIHYADISAFPLEAYCPKWIEDLEELDLYREPSDYIPTPGDLIFFDHENDGIVDHVGLVETVEDIDMTTIEGDSGDAVERNEYELFDKTIVGYGLLSALPAKQPQEDIPEIEDAPVIGDTPGVEASDDIHVYDAWAELIEPDGEAELQEQSSFFSGLFSAFSTNRRLTAYNSRVASLDLTPYIDNVKMYDMAKNEIPNGAVVTEGDMIEFRIEYTVDGQQLGVMNGNTVSVTSNTLTYNIPSTFQIVRDSSGDIRNSAGSVVGTYTINSETGIITMVFNDTYVEDNAKGNAIHGFISFFSTVTKVTEGDDEYQNYKFTDNISLGVTIEENTENIGDLSVEKSVHEVYGDKIYFVLVISSTEGTSGPVTLRDILTNELEYYDGIWRYVNGQYVMDNTLVPTVAADKRSFSLTLPQMAAGETIRIRYAADLDESLLDSNLTVGNTATVESVDNHDVPLTDSASVDYTYKLLNKTHTVNADGSVSWSIRINESNLDISGWVLSDVFRTESGNAAYEGTVTVTNDNGNVLAENESLPFTFPEGSTGTYVVTYTTSADMTDQINYNMAYLRYGDLEISDRDSVGVGTPVVKSGQLAGNVYQNEDGTYMIPIDWTVTVNTYGGEMEAGEYFEDKMRIGYDALYAGDTYVTYDALMAIFAHFEDVIGAAGGHVGRVQATAYVPGTGVGNVYNREDLLNKTDGCDTFKFEEFRVYLDQPIPEGQVFTFRYQTTGIFPENIISKAVYTNRFNVNGRYEVHANVNYDVGSVNITKLGIPYYDPNGSTGAQDWTGTTGSLELKYERLKKGYLAWAIELSVPPDYGGMGDVTIFEDLPDGIIVRRLDMAFNEGIPGGRQILDNLEPGNTYTYDFVLYTAEQYATWNTGGPGTPSRITVEVTDDGDLIITVPGDLLAVEAEYAEIRERDEYWTYFHIYTQIDGDFEWTPTEENPYVYVNSFENRVTAKDENGTPIDISSQTQTVTKDDSNKVLRKDASSDGSIISYSVLINGTELDLIEHSSILRIHDELTYVSTDDQFLRLRLVPGSVKLYEANVFPHGSYTLGKELNISYQYNESSTEENGVTTWVHTIDLDVPDGKAVVLVYEYSATGDKEAVHNVANTCGISGVGEGGLTGGNKLELEVKESTAQADIQGVILYKVDANNDGLYLPNAKFNLYIWNKEQNKYIIVHHPNNGNEIFVTNASGQILLDKSTVDPNQFAYNTAYYIVEVESPNGYYLGPEPYYFYIHNENVSNFPYCMPDGFTGHKLVNGDIIYRDNTRDTTEITIEKYWQHFNESPIDVTVDQVGEVKIELWQMLEGDPSSARVYGTYTIVPDETGDWHLTVTKLPKATRNADDTKGTDYLYYVKEMNVDGYELVDVQNNSGINSGVIKLTNRQQAGYELPETGGAGTYLYTAGGLLLMAAAVTILLYNHKLRRKEDFTSS